MKASPRSTYLTNCCVSHNTNIHERDMSNRTEDTLFDPTVALLPR